MNLRRSYSTLSRQVIRAENPRWAIVQQPHGGWVAAEPWSEDCSRRTPNRDRYFDNYSDALAYAIEQAESDAIIKGSVE